jgi:hypothetical protein
LGQKFNLAKFHDYLLKQGPMPLDVLETVMNDWAKELKVKVKSKSGSRQAVRGSASPTFYFFPFE